MLTAFAIWTLLASLITAFLYWWDKRAAGKDLWRVSEKTLLSCSVLGGWPGGLIAGKLIRHKTQKTTYRIQFFLAAVLHVLTVGVVWFKGGF